MATAETARERIPDLWRLGPSEVVALVGAGGKTCLMETLARDYEAGGHRVVLTTTTRILAPAPCGRPLIVADSLPDLLSSVRRLVAADAPDATGGSPVVGAGLDDQGKVVGVDPEWVRALRDVPGVEAVLVEADGAAGRALKAPAEWEPVVPPCTSLVVSVTGLDAQGAPLDAAHVHRPDVLAALLGLAAGDCIPPSALLRAAVRGYRPHVSAGARFLVFLNKADRWPLSTELEAAATGGGDEVWAGQLSPHVEMRCLRPTDEAPTAVILAGGLGSRMGGGRDDTPKVLAGLGEGTVVGCVVRAAVDSRSFGGIVVVGGREVEALRGALREEVPAGGYEVVWNPRPEEGLASSLRLGVLAMREPRDLLVALGDQPLVTPETFRRVLETWAVARDRGAAAVGLGTGFPTGVDVPTAWIAGATAGDRGVVGPPVVIHRSLLPMVLELTGDSGARDILRRYAGRVESVPAMGGETLDVDSPEDLDHIRGMLAEDGPPPRAHVEQRSSQESVVHPTEETTGVFRLPVFTPFDTEPTNAYVLLGRRVALFDTGLKHPRARADLLRGLAELGLEPRDVDAVFISHAHVDHHGLVHEFSEAGVLAGPEDLHKLQDFAEHVGAFAAAVARLLPRWGVPASLLGVLDAWTHSMAAMGDSVSRAAGLPAGEVVTGFGDPWTVLALPGHTEGGMGLYRETDGVLLAGDHLLERITPNPGLYLFLDPVKSGLGEYMASLDALRTMDISLVLPGHGRPFGEVVGRIGEIVRQYDRRVLDVEKAFEGGSTVFHAVSQLFPGVDPINGFLAMGEVFGHAERLVAAGVLRRDREGEVDVYGPVADEGRAAGERPSATGLESAGAECEGDTGGSRREPR